jgi:hypothetical protein
MEFLVGLVAIACILAFTLSGKHNYIDQVNNYSDAYVDIYQWTRTGIKLTPEELRIYKKSASQAQAIRGISAVILCFCLLYFFSA